MVVNLLIFLLIVGFIYILAYPDSELAATTTALGEVWSGGCRLSCRAGHRGYSGPRETIPGSSQDDKRFLVDRPSCQGSSECVCASCLCPLIENVFRTCRPATNMYSSAVQMFTTIYYSVLDTLSEIYNNVETILSRRASIQRPQILQNNGSETLYFGKKLKDGIEKAKDNTTKLDSGVRPSKSIVFRDVSDPMLKQKDDSSSKNAPSGLSTKTDTASKLKREDEESIISEASNSCPQCIKDGKICLKHCPKAAKKK